MKTDESILGAPWKNGALELFNKIKKQTEKRIRYGVIATDNILFTTIFLTAY